MTMGTYLDILRRAEQPHTDYVDAADWLQASEDGRRFIAHWGEQAEALGWGPADLFGLHTPPEKPAPSYRRSSRYDETGLIWLLHGRPVIALTETVATILAPSGVKLSYQRTATPRRSPLGLVAMGPPA